MKGLLKVIASRAQRSAEEFRRGGFGMGSGYGYGPYGPWGNRTGGTTFDYAAEAGVRYDNSAVMALVLTGMRAVTEVSPRAGVEDDDEKFTPITNHPLTQLLREPMRALFPDGQPVYNGHDLLQAINLSLDIKQNAYLYKWRSAAGKLIALEFISPWKIRPIRLPNSENFIDHYLYQSGTGAQKLSPYNVHHIRNGIDPFDDTMGLDILVAGDRHIVADNEANTYSAALTRNGAVTSALISPVGVDPLTKEPIIYTADQREEARQVIREKTTGDRRNEPIIAPFDMRVQKLGMTPQEMVLEGVHDLSEERLSALWGIPAIIALFGTGLANSSDRAGITVAKRMFYLNYVFPRWRLLGRGLSPLTDELGQRGQCVRMNTSDSAGVKDLHLDTLEVLVSATGGPVLTPNEGRNWIDFEPIKGADELREKQAPAVDPKNPEVTNDQRGDSTPDKDKN